VAVRDVSRDYPLWRARLGRLRAKINRVNVAARFLAYGVAGLTAELAWTGLRERPRTSLWMLPVYGGAQLAFEPVHDSLRARSVAERACAYGLGFTCVEYASGRALRALRGEAPWDYAHARAHLHGLIRADYIPVWACAGLAFERLHDALAYDHR
jgi:hypothetical protein